MLLLSGQGLYSQAIVISALEGFELLDCLIGFVVEEGRIIRISNPALQDLHLQQKRELLEDLDIIDIIKEIGRTLKRKSEASAPL